jgi:hypothetical protein
MSYIVVESPPTLRSYGEKSGVFNGLKPGGNPHLISLMSKQFWITLRRKTVKKHSIPIPTPI